MNAEPRRQTASFQYLQWQELYLREKPFQVFADVPEGAIEQLTNLVFDAGPPEQIHDLTGKEHEFTLDGNGFQVIRHQLPDTFDVRDLECMTSQVIPYLEEFIRKEVEGADFVRCFDWGYRKNANIGLPKMDANDKMHVLFPGKQVHCDQSPTGALNRLKEHAPEMVNKARAGRLRILNFWSPRNHAAQDNTLALCDGSTVDDADCVEADHISRTWLGNTMYGMYSPSHRWYYLHHQEPGDNFLFKIFDSDPTVPAKRSLHASFDYADVPKDVLPRESIEVRFVVVTEPRS